MADFTYSFEFCYSSSVSSCVPSWPFSCRTVWAVSPCSSTPTQDWKALIYCPPPTPPTISQHFPCVFHPPSASSVSPPTSREARHAANLLFLFNKQRRPASQSKLTSKDVNSRVRNQLTNSHTLVAAHVHTHWGQTSMGEWFYKHKWVLK